MSIILKGIDMPSDCYMVELVCYRTNPEQKYGLGGYVQNVPLKDIIQIPKDHGRLIDGDEFKSWVDDWYDCTDIGNIVESWIDERPTILEAEE